MLIRPLTPGFAVTGQITPEDVAEIAAKGFAAIVCNRPDGEAEDQPSAAQIAEAAAANGLTFSFIPVTPGVFTDEQARELSAFLGGVDGRVLAYCRSGARSGSLWEHARDIASATD